MSACSVIDFEHTHTYIQSEGITQDFRIYDGSDQRISPAYFKARQIPFCAFDKDNTAYAKHHHLIKNGTT